MTSGDPDRCPGCGADADDVPGCLSNPLLLVRDADGTETIAERIVYIATETHPACPGCSAGPDALHHLGCPFEICPACATRRLRCPCDTHTFEVILPAVPQVNQPRIYGMGFTIAAAEADAQRRLYAALEDL
jgi:hypothetical protein